MRRRRAGSTWRPRWPRAARRRRLSAFFDLVQQDGQSGQLIAEAMGSAKVVTRLAASQDWTGMERQVPRHRARLLAGSRPLGGVASPTDRSSDLYEATGRRPSASIQFRHRPRRVSRSTTGLVQLDKHNG